MSSIVTSLTGGGGAGMAFKPQAANILQPATVAQADTQYGNVNAGLGNQAGFLQALQAQNGIQNQQDVFGQLQGVANGTGPNPAQAQLANATGANIANQSAMMAGQRGSSANPGLIARQASMQGGNIQQQAAGQAASLQAQQSLNALNQMQGLATNQVNQQSNATNAYTNSALGAQQNVLGAIGAQNNANVGMTSNMNTTAGGLAQGVAGQQGGLMGNLMGGVGSAMNMLGGGSSAAGAGGAASGAADWGGIGEMAGDSGGIADVASMAATGGKVGDLPKVRMANGGDVAPTDGTTPLQLVDASATPMAPTTGPKSNVGKSFMDQEDALGAPSAQAAPMSPMGKAAAGGAGGLMGGVDAKALEKTMGQGQDFVHNAITGEHVEPGEDGGSLEFNGGDALKGGGKGAMFGSNFGPWGTVIGGAAGLLGGGITYQAQGGKVPAMVSPGETYLPPNKVKQVEKGANPLAVGKRIPGKPKVKGNSYANDIVPATLESGGIVIPNSIMQSKNPAKGAADFVRQIQSKNHMKAKNK